MKNELSPRCGTDRLAHRIPWRQDHRDHVPARANTRIRRDARLVQE